MNDQNGIHERTSAHLPSIKSAQIRRTNLAKIKSNAKTKSNEKRWERKITSTTATNQLSQSAIDNLVEIESEIETSSQYFIPRPGKTYIIRIDPENKIEPVETERFKDAQGRPLKRYQFKIAHVNNGKEQLWETSKTVCSQIITELKNTFTVLKVTRNGSDRNTTYTIEGVQ